MVDPPNTSQHIPHGQPPKRGISVGAVLGVTCGVILVFGGGVVVGAHLPSTEDIPVSEAVESGVESEPTSGIVEEASAKPEEDRTEIETTLEHDSWSITVVAVRWDVAADRLDGSFEVEPDGEWVVVEMEATNIGSEPDYFEEMNQLLVDATGNSYGYENAASKTSGLGSVNPGGQVSVSLAFDIPVDVEISHMIVNGTFMGEGLPVELS